MSGIGFTKLDPQGHEGKTNVWLTPRWILDLLGPFDLDPAAHKGWNTATEHFYEHGLEREWFGRVWLNPPYGRNVEKWLQKLSSHGNGIALVFVRTDTQWFQKLAFDAVRLIKGRVAFLTPHLLAATNAGAPSMLIAWGKNNVSAIENVPGRTITERE